MSDNIEQLICRIAADDDELAFGELYRSFFPGLLSFVNSIVRNREEAEEIVLDVFTKLWENRKTLKKIKSLQSYLYIAAKYSSIDLLRKQRHFSFDELTESAPYQIISPEETVISKENIERINQAIGTLPERCLLIFRLVKEERLKYGEVAELLNISVKTVEAQLYIAMKKLTEILKPSFKNKVTKSQ